MYSHGSWFQVDDIANCNSSGGLAICIGSWWPPSLLRVSSHLSNLLQGCVAMGDLRMVWDVLFSTNPQRLRALVAGREQPCDAEEQCVASLFEVHCSCDVALQEAT